MPNRKTNSGSIAMSLLAVIIALPLLALSVTRGNVQPPDETALQNRAAAAFGRLVKLVGEWEAENQEGVRFHDRFELIASGSVVMQTTIFVANPESTMVTMYHLDGDQLMLTHYCVARNQPRMKATAIADDQSTIEFEFMDGTNMTNRDDGHMDHASYEFIDADHFNSNWTWYQDGESAWDEDLLYTRKTADKSKKKGNDN